MSHDDIMTLGRVLIAFGLIGMALGIAVLGAQYLEQK